MPADHWSDGRPHGFPAGDQYSDVLDVLGALHATELDNVPISGYGVKAYALSMVQAAVTATGGRIPASVIGELKRIFDDFPGESEVVLEVYTSTGTRKLRFGDGFKVNGRDAALKAELHKVLGDAVLLQAVPQPA